MTTPLLLAEAASLDYAAFHLLLWVLYDSQATLFVMTADKTEQLEDSPEPQASQLWRPGDKVVPWASPPPRYVPFATLPPLPGVPSRVNIASLCCQANEDEARST
jgi:hypothetical protein